MMHSRSTSNISKSVSRTDFVFKFRLRDFKKKLSSAPENDQKPSGTIENEKLRIKKREKT